MAAKNVSGSNRAFSVDGVPYGIAFDSNIAETISQFEKEVIESSGDPMVKYTKRNRMREGIVLITNASEREDLVAQADGLAILKLSYTNAAGDVYKCRGALEVETNETEENRTACKALPTSAWTLFVNG
ncbi:hypothetical protein KAR91_16955 [Candidatus Pacearchaeota archaeon]|nr:hypothetical protein [Candidatus Pacearchaeota archaeon]